MTVSIGGKSTLDHLKHEAGTLSPRERDTLWDMEEHFWSSGAENARATTASNAVMIFPYPPSILQGDQIWTHIRKRTGWRSVVMAERRVTRCRDIAILTYRVSAEKADVPIFEALCASTYLLDKDKWLRFSHQQTTGTGGVPCGYITRSQHRGAAHRPEVETRIHLGRSRESTESFAGTNLNQCSRALTSAK